MSDARFGIRRYEAGDEVGILELFNAVFAEDNPDYAPRTLEHWNWEFRDNPVGNQIVLGVSGEGRIIAQYCCLPYPVNLRGEKTVAGCGVDSFLHPDYRQGLKREGIWLRVARHYFKTLAQLPHTSWGYGYPNDKAYRVGVRLLKYHEIRKPQPTLVRDLAEHPDPAEVGVGLRLADPDWEEVSRFDARFDAFWQEVMPRYPMATWRDAEYLNWRFVAPPGVTYLRFALLDASGAVRGFFVARADWQDAAILCVPEVFCDPRDEAAFATLLYGVAEAARRTNQARIEMWFPPTSPHFEMASRMGFIAEPSPFNLVGRFYRDDLDLDYARAHWFYTLGDMDVL